MNEHNALEQAWLNGYKQGRQAVEKCGPIDVAVVVRCKDCKMFRDGGNWPNCFAWGRNTDENGWCYLAERKSNG